MVNNLLEKLQLKDEKNLLIQGLPSSIEKQFTKLSFAKNLTPLLKSKRIDFALIFAVNERQLNSILAEVLPALQKDAKLWVAYPKTASKIVTDLNRDASWNYLGDCGFTSTQQMALDHVWMAMHFVKEKTAAEKLPAKNAEPAVAGSGVNFEDRSMAIPEDLASEFKRHKTAMQFFEELPFIKKKEYVDWITSAKKEATREKRVKDTIDKLNAARKNPLEKA
jgi:hypothetical protein